MINENLKKYRKAYGLTQKQLAAKTGVSAGYIQMIELGKKNNPSIDLLQKIATALDITTPQLLGEVTIEKSNEKMEFYENLCNVYLKGAITWSKDRMITDTEDTIKIQAHLSELLLRYKKMVENYAGQFNEIIRIMAENEEFDNISEEGKFMYIEEALTNALERDMEEMAMWIKMFAMKVTRPL